MCTNYRPTARDIVQERFAAELVDDAYPPEAFPGYLAPIVRRSREPLASATAPAAREALLGRFGLIPHWARDDTIGRRTYNARTETVAEKPSFRTAWAKAQRCIVPMDHFFEPNWESGKAVRWRLAHAQGEPLGVAGLWAWWRAPNGAEVHSFTMLTVNADAHPVMNHFHRPGEEKRMLVILPPADYDAWLAAPVDTAPAFFRPCPADALVASAAPLPPRVRR